MVDTDAPAAREGAIDTVERARQEATPVEPKAFETLVESDLQP